MGALGGGMGGAIGDVSIEFNSRRGWAIAESWVSAKPVPWTRPIASISSLSHIFACLTRCVPLQDGTLLQIAARYSCVVAGRFSVYHKGGYIYI